MKANIINDPWTVHLNPHSIVYADARGKVSEPGLDASSSELRQVFLSGFAHDCLHAVCKALRTTIAVDLQEGAIAACPEADKTGGLANISQYFAISSHLPFAVRLEILALAVELHVVWIKGSALSHDVAFFEGLRTGLITDPKVASWNIRRLVMRWIAVSVTRLVTHHT